MRIVIFTGHANIESSPWWPVIAGNTDVEAVLICRQLPASRHGAGGRFLRNLRKHGPLWIPYRLLYAATSVVRRLIAADTPADDGREWRIHVDRVAVPKLAAPETIERVKAWRPDLGLSLGAPILKADLFSTPTLGTLNVHEGAVPDFRGAPPGFWELFLNATEIGATIHWVEAGLDTGPVVAEARAPIYPADSLADVVARAEELSVRVLEDALRRVLRGDTHGAPQRPAGSTHRSPVLGQRAALWCRLSWRRVRRQAHPRHLAKMAFARVWLAAVRPVRDLVRAMRGRQPVRVFTFHRVTTLCRDGMTVSPDVLHRQLGYIRRHHDIVSLDRAISLIANPRPHRRPVAAISFDDGYRSVFRSGLPIFKHHAATACCFVCTKLVGTDRRLPHDDGSPVRAWLDLMGWNELLMLREAGWEIGGHTESHPRLADLVGATLDAEVRGPYATLTERFGKAPIAMAYPFGGPSDITPEGVETARTAGYSALFSDFGGENVARADPFELRRIDIGGDHDTLAWKASTHGLDLSGWGRRIRRAGRAS